MPDDVIRFLPIPYAAIEAVDISEHGAVVDLYHRAHARRWRSFKITERSLATKWGVSARRVWSILERLEDDDLLTICKGSKRKQTVLCLRCPTSEIVKHSGQHSGQQNGAGRKPDIEESEAQGEAQGEAPSTRHEKRQREKSSPPSTADGWAALSTRTVKALSAAGLHTPEAVAALTRREIKTRPGIGDKTANEIFIALDSLGLTFRPEPAKEPAIRKDVKPLTDAWARIWLSRRGHKYDWSWFKRDRRAARDFFGLCGTDVDLFERAVGHYFDAEDAGQWPERPASFSKAAHNASDWVNSARQVNGKGHTPANLKAEAAAVLGKINVLIRDRRWRPADLGDSPHADAARAGLAACGGIDDFRRSRDEIGDRIRFVAGYIERRTK